MVKMSILRPLDQPKIVPLRGRFTEKKGSKAFIVQATISSLNCLKRKGARGQEQGPLRPNSRKKGGNSKRTITRFAVYPCSKLPQVHWRLEDVREEGQGKKTKLRCEAGRPRSDLIGTAWGGRGNKKRLVVVMIGVWRQHRGQTGQSAQGKRAEGKKKKKRYVLYYPTRRL